MIIWHISLIYLLESFIFCYRQKKLNLLFPQLPV